MLELRPVVSLRVLGCYRPSGFKGPPGLLVLVVSCSFGWTGRSGLIRSLRVHCPGSPVPV